MRMLLYSGHVLAVISLHVIGRGMNEQSFKLDTIKVISDETDISEPLMQETTLGQACRAWTSDRRFHRYGSVQRAYKSPLAPE